MCIFAFICFQDSTRNIFENLNTHPISKASVIVVNYNGKRFLKDCFDSLLNQSYTNFEIIFVDNNSQDGSVDLIRRDYSSDKIRIVISDKNLGFAGGNNLGYKHCTGEYIVLLNNDTVVDRDWLKQLIACLESDEQAGMAQSLVLTEGIPAKYYEKNGTVNLLGHNIMEFFEIDKDGIGEIFLASGCSLIIRKSLVEEIGGLFPEEYFAYAEDTYLCFKVKFRGLKILHTSKSVVHHKGGGTSANSKPSDLYFYKERNRLLNFLIFFSGSFVIRYIPYLVFNFLLKLFASVFSKKYTASQLIEAYVWLITNIGWIKSKRRELNAIKTKDEDYVLGYLTSKIFNGDNISQRIINFFSLLYCRISFIRIFENK